MRSRFPGLPAVIALLLMSVGVLSAQERYRVRYHPTGKDTSIPRLSTALKEAFADSVAAASYLSVLRGRLLAEGRWEASVDSARFAAASADVWLHVGPLYRWEYLSVSPAHSEMLEEAGWDFKPARGSVAVFPAFERARTAALERFADKGHPFAAITIDSVVFREGWLRARLQVDKGPAYRIDSLVVTGGLRLQRGYLHRYLGIAPGSAYRQDRIDAVDARLRELPFLKETHPASLEMLGTGAVLNLFLEERKASQADLLVGFLPDNAQVGGRMLLTGEANVHLQNALGGGEAIRANWQQIQVGSPRLRIGYAQPYVLGTDFGVDAGFELFRKDSSFLNLQARLGLQYLMSARRSGKLLYQRNQTRLLDVDTQQVKRSLRLPAYLDVAQSTLGIEYQFDGTDYRFNPRRGSLATVSVGVGTRTVRRNSAITALRTDAAGKPFDFAGLYDTVSARRPLLRWRVQAARFLPLSRKATLRLALDAGRMHSRSLFRNELFQIGGYRLLRGFDEESIFASGYAVATVEYRLPVGTNSYLYAFVDAGHAANRAFGEQARNGFLGTGLGMALETRAGLLNLGYALGARDDIPFQPRQSKIHFGLSGLF